MKKLVFAFCMLFGAVVVVNAQDSTSTKSPSDPTSTTQTQNPSTGYKQEDGRMKIKSQELPDGVKSALESQEYRGWLVNSAYKMEGASNSSTGSSADNSGSVSNSGSTSSTSDSTSVSGGNKSGAYTQDVYVVELKNGAQTKTVRFDKDGKKLDDGDKDDQK
jgi:hypothetical protein